VASSGARGDEDFWWVKIRRTEPANEREIFMQIFLLLILYFYFVIIVKIWKKGKKNQY
jgi:hypothetical protein